MRLFTDNPISSTEEDEFGFAPYARILAGTIRDTERLPFCIGIFGAWGSGKSSFMKMLEVIVTKPPGQSGMKSIWFSPWKYDKKEDLWNALIQTILYQIADDSNNDEIKKKARNLALSTTWLVLKKSVTALSAGVVSEGNLDALLKAFGEQDALHYQHINHFEEDFKQVIDLYTGGTGSGKLVIFIDDLDRCLPENAITVLESLKLFIGDARCIFVLGMDHYVVEWGIRYRFKEEINITGRDYLDKIIQIPFFLPPVPFAKLQASVADGAGAHVQPEVVWDLVRFGMGGNPRKTKRFVNCFYLLRQILNNPNTIAPLGNGEKSWGPTVTQTLSEDQQNVHLAKILVFQMNFPDFYLHLQSHPGDWLYMEKELIQADDADKRDQALQRNSQLESFWKDDALRTFMRNTQHRANAPYYFPPEASIVEALLQAVSLVTETPESPSFESPIQSEARAEGPVKG